MDKLDIEIKYSPTGSCSSWHLEIAEKHKVPLMVTSDVAYFMRVGEDVYRINRPRDYYELYKLLLSIEEKNDSGEMTDDETIKFVDDLVNNRIDGFCFGEKSNLIEYEKMITNELAWKM